MKRRKIKQTYSQRIKTKARRGLNREIPKVEKTYVVDTSAIIHKFLSMLTARGIKSKIIIPNAVMAELENLANKGQEIGFIGLEEITNLHKLRNKGIDVFFQGIRPDEKHIKYAHSGEIDALIREIAIKNKAILVTADLVQAKSAQAYGLNVVFLRPVVKPVKKKRKFLFFTRK